MKFELFYEELLDEQRGRPMSPEKFEAITQNIGRWIFNFFIEHPVQFSRIPFFSEFREFARGVATPDEDVDDIEQLVLMIEPEEDGSNLMYDWLNQMPNILKAQEFIKKVGDMFEPIGKRIKYYNRPDDYIPVRGRKPKEKPEGKEDEQIPSIMKTRQPKTVDVDVEVTEPKRRGRKPSLNTLEKMETKYYKMYDDLEKQLRAMKELSSKINDYKKYFSK